VRVVVNRQQSTRPILREVPPPKTPLRRTLVEEDEVIDIEASLLLIASADADGSRKCKKQRNSRLRKPAES
jgi:hypothetical protein